jgi:lipopolysaccharide export system permease protein
MRSPVREFELAAGPRVGRRGRRRWGFSWTFARYLGRVLVASVLMVTAGLVLLVVLFDAIEQLRRSGGRESGGIGDVIELALLHAPSTAQQLLPFTMLFAAMLSFRRLSRSNELVAARAAGISIWQLLIPVWVIAFVLGSVAVMVLNPVSAALYARYETQIDMLDDGQIDRMDIASGGLWLRQSWNDKPIVVHARGIADGQVMSLADVTIFLLDENGGYAGRIDAPGAELADGFWLLRDAMTAEPTGAMKRSDLVRIPTNLSPERIHGGLALPDTISFWALPDYIATLRSIGLPTRGHVVHYQNLLATPLMFAAMLLIGTVFSLRFGRRGGTFVFVAMGIASGFVFFVFANVVLAVGLSGRLPAELAAWTPAVVGILLGLALLFHTEDG